MAGPTGQKQGLRTFVEDLPDEVRLVDVLHAPLAELAEVIDADRDGTQHGWKTRVASTVAGHKPARRRCCCQSCYPYSSFR